MIAKWPKVSCEKLLIKPFLSHAIMAFKVVGGRNPVPDPSSSRILREVLAKLWKFSCHSVLLSPPCDYPIAPVF